jgi:type I restriction enzyme R subunit
VQQLDFEFVLFASALVDYDYIMALIARYTQGKPDKQKMTKEQLINLLSSSANLIEERDDIVEYINSLEVGKALSENEIREGFENFKEEKSAKELATIADKHGLKTAAVKIFVDSILDRMIFDGEQLNELLAPLQLNWKDRTKKELALMEDLVPQLKRLAQGREISGLSAYDV